MHPKITIANGFEATSSIVTAAINDTSRSMPSSTRSAASITTEKTGWDADHSRNEFPGNQLAWGRKISWGNDVRTRHFRELNRPRPARTFATH
jgi:hypothetical protein